MSSNSFSVLLPSCTYTNYYKEYAKCLDIIQQFDSGLQCFHLPAAKCSQETLFHLILCGGKLKCHTRVGLAKAQRACGAMDNASDYGSEDSRFESWQARRFLLLLGLWLLKHLYSTWLLNMPGKKEEKQKKRCHHENMANLHLAPFNRKAHKCFGFPAFRDREKLPAK